MMKPSAPVQRLRLQAALLEAWSNVESGPPLDYVRVQRSALRAIAENIVVEVNKLTGAASVDSTRTDGRVPTGLETLRRSQTRK